MKVQRLGRRTLSLLLALVMTFSLAAEALAADDVYATDADGNTYTSISGAWDAAKRGAVITMARDWKLSDRLKLGKKETATLNMNGHRIARELSDYKSDGEVIYLEDSANLTLTGSDSNGNAQNARFDFMGWSSTTNRTTCEFNWVGGLVTGGWSSNGAGGIHMKQNAKLTLDNVAVAGNGAEDYGGGVMMDGEGIMLIMKNGAMIRNNTASYGGGVYINKKNGTIKMSDESKIDYNYSKNGGGGIYSYDLRTVLDMSGNSEISYNSASEGGGIYLDYTQFTVRSRDATGRICENEARSGKAGAIYMEHNRSWLVFGDANWGTITGFAIEGNKSSDKGGALYIQQEGITVNNCKITSNTSGGAGGAIFLDNDANTIAGCTITKNSATNNGGGVFSQSGHNLALSGTVVIKDNTSGGSKCNLYLGADTYLTSTPSSYSEVGISTKAGERDIGAEADFFYEKGFFSDHPSYSIVFDEETYKLRRVSGTKASGTETTTVRYPETQETGKTYNGKPVVKGYFSYASIGDSEADIDSNFYYSDGYFLDNPEQYNAHLATMSMTMAMASMGSNIGCDGKLTKGYDLDYTYKSQNIEKLLTDIGVDSEEIYIKDTYSVKPTTSSIGMAIGQKNFDGYAVVPIVVRSAGYESEWSGNVTIGSSGEHEGFAKAAKQVFEEVQDYIDRYGLTEDVKNGKVKFWIMGYSRGGATANLTAKRLVEAYCGGTDGKNNQVYAYCFEAPQGGRNSAMKLDQSKYLGIHNCINKVDIVAEVVPDEMGFIRYGVDHYVPGEAEASNTPSKDQTVWSYVNKQSWASSYCALYDNESYTVGSTQYNTQRTKMLEQLKAIDPLNICFYDCFQISELNYVPPKLSKLDGDTITQEQFNRIFLRSLQAWGFYDSSSGDFRSGFVESNKGASFQDALQVVTKILYGKSAEDMEGITEAVGSVSNRLGYGTLYDIWDDMIGDWTSLSQSERETYCDQLWKLLMEEAPLGGEAAVHYLTQGEQKELRSVWYTLMDVLLRFVEVDYTTDIDEWNTSAAPTGAKKTTPILEGVTNANESYDGDSQVVVGTLLQNINAVAQGHYPEVNFAWLRSYDDYYTDDKNRIQITTTNVPVINAVYQDGTHELKLSTHAKTEGAAIFYRISTNDGKSYKEWKPYNLPISLPEGNTAVTYTVQMTAVYCGNTSEVKTECYTVEPSHTYSVTVNGDVVGSFKQGDTVTVDATSTDENKLFRVWKDSDTVTLTNKNNAVTTFTMPAQDVSLTAEYLTQIEDVTLTVDKPVAGQALPETGALSWTDDDGKPQTKTVSAYWLEQVDDKTQTASGTAKYGTKYSVAALVERDRDSALAFSFKLSDKTAKVSYGGDETNQVYSAYVDDAGALRIFGKQVETDKATIQSAPDITVSVKRGSSPEQLKAALPESVTATLNDNTQATLALDIDNANTDEVMEDGEVRKDGTVFIPIVGTEGVNAGDMVLAVMVTVQSGTPIDAPSASAETEKQNSVNLLSAAADVSANETYYARDLYVTLSSTTEGATIRYRIGNGEAKTYKQPLSLHGNTGEKTTFVITAWAETENDGKSSEVTYTYVLDNPFIVTIHGKDTGIKGLQGEELWTKEYRYYNGDKVVIGAPSEQDELFEKWESIPEGVSGKQTDTALTVDSLSGNMELSAIYNPVVNKLDLTLDAPAVGAKLPATITKARAQVTDWYELTEYFDTIAWTPNNGTASTDTVYTAKLTLKNPKGTTDEGAAEAAGLKYYLSEKLALNVNDDSSLKASVAKENDAVYVTFPKADKLGLVSVKQLDSIGVSHDEAADGDWSALLPKQTTITLADGNTRDVDINWTAQPAFDAENSDAQSLTAKGTAVIPDDVNSGSVSTDVTITVFVAPETQEIVAMPTASIASGTYTEAQSVRLSCETDGATIYYTLDGESPTTESMVYDGGLIEISETAKLKAIAVKDGMRQSVEVSYRYEISEESTDDDSEDPTPAPTPSPTPRPYWLPNLPWIPCPPWIPHVQPWVPCPPWIPRLITNMTWTQTKQQGNVQKSSPIRSSANGTRRR